MRQISALALAIGFAATLVACGGSQPPAETGGTEATPASTETTPAATSDEQRGIVVHDSVNKCELPAGTAPSADSCATVNCSFNNGKCIPGTGSGAPGQ